ncbi:hypothetical protein LBMAG42_33560 [Deltaproteobacteria bacterium]|nr:hypothetical protein LBMAG42_33560 [Deltaproteobacteria bacterium]
MGVAANAGSGVGVGSGAGVGAGTGTGVGAGVGTGAGGVATVSISGSAGPWFMPAANTWNTARITARKKPPKPPSTMLAGRVPRPPVRITSTEPAEPKTVKNVPTAPTAAMPSAALASPIIAPKRATNARRAANVRSPRGSKLGFARSEGRWTGAGGGRGIGAGGNAATGGGGAGAGGGGGAATGAGAGAGAGGCTNAGGGGIGGGNGLGTWRAGAGPAANGSGAGAGDCGWMSVAASPVPSTGTCENGTRFADSSRGTVASCEELSGETWVGRGSMLPSSTEADERARATRSSSAALVICVRSSPVAVSGELIGAAAASGRRMRIGFPHFRHVALFTSRVSLESGIL